MLCAGADFYSTPELSASGRLAWTQWNHPNMPWDSTTIMVGSLSGTTVVSSQSVAGGPSESAVQPRWLGDKLIFVSDRTNWWNLYLWSEDGVRPLCATEAEFCEPQWILGQRPYAIIDDDHLLCSINRSGEQSIAVLRNLRRQTSSGSCLRYGRYLAGRRRPQRRCRAQLTRTGRRRWRSSTSISGSWTDSQVLHCDDHGCCLGITRPTGQLDW